MKVLVVKLSSLGDVVHAMPAVQDILLGTPDVQVDWVLEPAFAPLVARVHGVRRVIPCALRAWRRAPLSAASRAGWRAFKAELRTEAYDAVIDLQGLTKSALVSRVAQLAPAGKRYAMANRTEGSSYEWPTRWVADTAIALEPRVHAVARARLLCAAALGYDVPENESFGLLAGVLPSLIATKKVAFVMGSSRADKQWPMLHWARLGGLLMAAGHALRLVHGNDAEQAACRDLARRLGRGCELLPRLPLDALLDELSTCIGVVGVDSGVSHMAVALGLPHVQIYNFDTAWRTGPQGQPQQVSVFGRPAPTPDAVWQAWRGLAVEGGAE